MSDVFRDMLAKSVIVYLDDILVYSPDYPTHVCQVLERLIQHNLFAKVEKCEFHKTEISYLGYRIGPKGVAME